MAGLEKNMERPDLDQVVNQKRGEESHSQESYRTIRADISILGDSSLADGYFRKIHQEGSHKVQGYPKPTPSCGYEVAHRLSPKDLQKNMERPDLDQVVNEQTGGLNLSDSSLADGYFMVLDDPKPTPPDGGKGAHHRSTNKSSKEGRHERRWMEVPLQKNMKGPDLDQVVNQKCHEERHSQNSAQDFVPCSLEASPKVLGDPKPTPYDGRGGAHQDRYDSSSKDRCCIL